MRQLQIIRLSTSLTIILNKGDRAVADRAAMHGRSTFRANCSRVYHEMRSAVSYLRGPWSVGDAEVFS